MTELRFKTLLDTVSNAINERLPKLKGCERHGGRFDVAELQRLSAKVPAVYLSAMAAPMNDSKGNGQRRIGLQLTAFVVAGDQRGLKRNDAAMNIAETLLTLIPDNQWGMNGVGIPSRITAQNLYSGQLDKKKIALWGVSWRQQITIGTDVFLTEPGPVPESLYLGETPVHIDDYEQVAGGSDAA